LSEASKVKDVRNSIAYLYCDKFEGTYWTLSEDIFLSWNERLGEILMILGLDKRFRQTSSAGSHAIFIAIR
jgi:hypothetical protein